MLAQSAPPPPHEHSGLKKRHRKGSSAARSEPQRTCLVSREVKRPADMIRFVLAPDATVVADLRQKLPGRGVWVTATRAAVEEAVRRKLFARGFRQQVTVPDDLADRIDGQLLETALGSLGLARKAGHAMTGYAKVEGALRDGNLAILFAASDGAEDGRRKLERIASGLGPEGPLRIELLCSDELSLALGVGNVIHAGVLKGDDARGILLRFARLMVFRGLPARCYDGVGRETGEIPQSDFSLPRPAGSPD